MRGRPSPAPPAAGGLLGMLRSWVRCRAGEAPPPSADASPGAGWPAARAYAAARVLVVDDNPVNLVVISALMESRGLLPLLAADGAEAVALACEMQFDLILMDLQMPVLDGWDATAAIRRFEAASSRPAVPVVAYSSTRPEADMLAQRGLNGSLDKPCDGDALEACLQRWCPADGEGRVR